MINEVINILPISIVTSVKIEHKEEKIPEILWIIKKCFLQRVKIPIKILPLRQILSTKEFHHQTLNMSIEIYLVISQISQ